jgi:hypothetical protein
MSQQTEINSVHLADGANDGESYNIRQMPFPTCYFGLRQALVILLCESCFWCASTSIVNFIKNPKCSVCASDRIALIPISRG